MKSSATQKLLAAGIAAMGVVAFMVRRRRSAGLLPVSRVDIVRFMGKWYEIARYSVPFANDCYGSTIEYTLRADGRITILSVCRKGSFDGPLQASEGIAAISDSRTNARVTMDFFWPFSGDFWVIELDRDYRYAVVGNPGMTAIWVLSRTPVMDEALYRRIVASLTSRGIDAGNLRRIPQVREGFAGTA